MRKLEIVPGQALPGVAQTVDYGVPAAEALAKIIDAVDANRVFLVVAKSLHGQGMLSEELERMLDRRRLATEVGVAAHSPWDDVLKIANSLKNADCVVTLGGGSICDAVKMARLCAANDVLHPSDVAQFKERLRARDVDITQSPVKFVAIVTALSASEFTPVAGITDNAERHKETFFSSHLSPQNVILDPLMTISTPDHLWFSTGVRAIDHAVENWCSINRTPLSDATSLHALRLLIPALGQVKKTPDDLAARTDCLVGAWLAMQGGVAGVEAGASHGIGHALGGTGGMGHGDTSCVMLAHVLRYNAKINSDRQASLTKLLELGASNLADVIESLVRSLGLPTRLRDAGLSHDKLAEVAKNAMSDRWVKTNPRPVADSNEVLRILQDAW